MEYEEDVLVDISTRIHKIRLLENLLALKNQQLEGMLQEQEASQDCIEALTRQIEGLHTRQKEKIPPLFVQAILEEARATLIVQEAQIRRLQMRLAVREMEIQALQMEKDLLRLQVDVDKRAES